MENYKYNEMLHKAIHLFQSGYINESESICNQLIKLELKNSDLYNLISIIRDQKGEIDSAIENINYAIDMQSDNLIYLTNIANFYRKKGDLNKAIEYLNKSLIINPEFHSSIFLLGNIYKEMGNDLEAERLFKQALKLVPNDYKSMNKLGTINLHRRSYDEAKKYFKDSMIICPEDLESKFSLVHIYYFEDDYEKSEYYCGKILEIVPNDIKALKQILFLLYLQSKVDEYKKVYRSYMNLVHTDFDDINRSREICLDLVASTFNIDNMEIDSYREFITKRLISYKPFRNKEFIDILDIEELQPDIQLSYHGRDNKEIKKNYYNLFKGYFDNKNIKFNKGKVKIGFLVTKTHEDIFVKFMSNIINSFPNNEFDIYVISSEFGWNSFIKDKMNQNINSIFTKDTFIKSANEILSYNLDILYHWEIGTARENYFLPFFRLAPVQCTSIGWPDTTGIKTVDYFISSVLIEIEDANSHYTEKLIKFNRLPFDINNPKVISENEIKPTEHLNFGCKNIYFCNQNLRKIHPDFDILVSGILNNDSDGIVLFDMRKDKSMAKLIKDRIKTKYPNIFDRVVFLNLSKNEYLSLMSISKVILDTLYFGGANTSYEAFAMNAPIVTFPWTHERGRYTLGCYKQMGIDGLVANSFEEYIDLAVKTAHNKDFRDKLVKDISENNHKLFNDQEVIQEYIDFFESVARNIN